MPPCPVCTLKFLNLGVWSLPIVIHSSFQMQLFYMMKNLLFFMYLFACLLYYTFISNQLEVQHGSLAFCFVLLLQSLPYSTCPPGEPWRQHMGCPCRVLLLWHFSLLTGPEPPGGPAPPSPLSSPHSPHHNREDDGSHG